MACGYPSNEFRMMDGVVCLMCLYTCSIALLEVDLSAQLRVLRSRPNETSSTIILFDMSISIIC